MNSLAIPQSSLVSERAMEYALYFLVVGVSISNAFAGIGVGAVLLAWVFKKAALREQWTLPRPLWILAVILFLAFAASLLNSEYLAKSVHALFLKYGKYLLLMFAIAEGVKDKRVAINIALILCVTATILCWDGFYQFFSGRDLLLFRKAGSLDVYHGAQAFHLFRVTATFPAANTFASYLVPVLMLGFTLSFFYKPKILKIALVKGVFLASVGACLLLTFSRGGLAACLAGILMLGVLLRKKILWIIPVIFLLAFFCGKNLYGNRAAQDGAIDPTVETRLFMLKDAAQMFKSHPWTGIGLNTYYRTHEKNRSLEIPPSYAHNSYVQMIAEVGVVGFMAFMALMLYWFRRGVSSFRKLNDSAMKSLLGGVLAGVFGLCTASFFDNVLFELQPATLFWVLLGYGIALSRIGSEGWTETSSGLNFETGSRNGSQEN